MFKYCAILLLNLLLICPANLIGQSIMRSSISCMGSNLSENGLLYRQTIGQSSNTQFVNNGETILRQGFQQPVAPVDLPVNNVPVDFTLYPNPADDFTSIVFQEQISHYSIIVYNINGVVVSKIDDQTLQTLDLDLSTYIPGFYIVTVIQDERIGKKKLVIEH